MHPFKSLTAPFHPEIYLKNWEAVEKKVAKKGFTWTTLYENEEDNQYMSDSLLQVPYSMTYEIENATRAVHDIYIKTYEQIIRHPAVLHELGLPIMLWDLFLKQTKTKFSYFTSYDFIASATGLKLIEANVDTPLGIVEAAVGQEVLCAEHNSPNPNSQMGKRIRDAWYRVIKDYNIRSTDTLFFTCADWDTEDKQTVLYLMSLYPQQAKYIPLEQMIVEKDAVRTPDGEKIEFLYRLYPLEYFLEERSRTGEPIGEQFLVHIMTEKVKVINPPSALLMQSKAILALITEKKKDWYTQFEQNVIEKYFLPTYFSPQQMQSYVKKPVLGREGGGIQIVVNGKVVEEDVDYYQHQQTVYQTYFPMPDQTIDTWDGPYTGKLLIGSHVFASTPSGLFFRLGSFITGNLSMFVPYTTI